MNNRGAVLHGPQDLRIEDLPMPEPGDGQVLVDVAAVGICGSDVHYYDHGRIGDHVVDAPMVLGHEAAGRIGAVGRGVDRSRIGQQVTLEPGVPCGHCRQCRAGRYNLCPDVVFFATPPVHGALAEHVVLDADFAHPVPAGMTHVRAAMAEPVSVGIWACRKAEVTPGDRVLVIGAGPVGLFAAQVARVFGAAAVEITDLSEHRLAVAASLGLDVVRSADHGPTPVDVLLECSGSAHALQTAFPRVARAGRVVLVGMGQDEVLLPVPQIQSREIRVTGTYRYAGTYADAVQLIASGTVQVDPVVTHTFPLERTLDALLAARRDPTALKSVVTIGESDRP